MGAANAAEQEFNSSDGVSDDDWDRSRFQRNENIGARQVRSIIARQVEDRLESKRNARKLTVMHGAPGSTACMNRVEATRDAFYTGLGGDTKVCPDGETIFRYVDTMTRHVKTVIKGKHAPSLSTIQGIWFRLIVLLTFRHSNLKEHYGNHEIKRIEVHLDQLVKRKLLIKGKWWKKQWFGFRVVEKMANAWIEKGLSDGCISWDRMLLKLLSIILMAALSARCGDVARTSLYKDMECLCWKDIELELFSELLDNGAPSVQNLRGKFTLRYCKEYKDTLNEDEVVYVDPFENRTQHAACCIKLLMILALRFGHVFGTTLEDVLEHTAKRSDKIVQWTRPDWPVICQMALGAKLPLQEPGNSDQLNHIVKQLALAAGILVRATTHAIKRGVARDMAHSKKKVDGVATAAVGLVLHHTKNSHNHGITQSYAGHTQTPTYNIRAEERFKDRLTPRMAASPIEITRNTTEEVDAYMVVHNMDKKVAKQRQAATKALKREKIEAAKASAQNAEASTPASKNASPLLQIGKCVVGMGKTLIFPHASVKTPEVLSGGPALSEKTKSAVNVSQRQLGRKEASGKVLLGHEDIPIDPQLLNLDKSFDDNDDEVDAEEVEALESLIFRTAQDTMPTMGASEAWETNEIADALVHEHLNEMLPLPDVKTSPLDLEADDFVTWFSRINVCKTQTARTDAVFAGIQASGNSRDPPTRFLYHCGLGECDYSSWGYTKVDKHQVSCRGINRSAVGKNFPCDTCDKSFVSAAALDSHVNQYHSFEPRACAKCPDKPGIIYYDPSSLQAHHDKVHNVFEEPRLCPLRDQSCNLTDKLYTSMVNLYAQGTSPSTAQGVGLPPGCGMRHGVHRQDQQ